MDPQQKFRFLDLPKEIRLMVYELLPNTITHRRSEFIYQEKNHGVTLVAIWRPTVVSCTCRMIHDEASTIVKRISRKATQTKQSLGGISGRYFNPQLIAESGSLAPLAARYGLVEWAIQSVSRVGLSLKEQIARHNAHLGLIGKEPPYNLDANMLEWIYQCAQISWTSDTDIDIVVCETSPVRAASQSFWSWAGVTWAIQKDEIDFRSNLEMLHGLEHLKANLIWLERDVSSNDEGGMVLARSRSAQLRDGDFIRNYNITDEEWGSQWRQQDWSIVPDSDARPTRPV